MPNTTNKLNNNDCHLIREATRKLVREFDVFRNIRPSHNLSLSQSHALIEIKKYNRMTLGELTELLGLNKSSISRILSSLKSSAYIKQLPHPTDSRVKPFSLTSKGEKLLQKINIEANKRVHNALAIIDIKSRNKIIAGLNIYADALRQSRLKA